MAGWYVTVNDIKNWTETNKRSAEEILPLLIKKLILASCKPDSMNFPSGDSVAVGGWDGMLEVNGEIEKEFIGFIPKGKSGWEFGTNNDVKGKADKDYEKRLDTPDPFILDQTTYVFVTSRLWTKRDEWVSTKKLDGEWKDVRGINAETLQDWLEKCPAVHRWFAEIVGKRSKDLWDVEQEWNKLSSATSVKLTRKFFLHNRTKEMMELKNNLDKGKNLYRVKFKSKLESYGFLLSVIMEDENLKARSLIIQNQETWDFISQSNYELILIPKGFIPNGLGAAISNGHTVVIPIDEMDTHDVSINLPFHQRLIRQEAIQELGFDKEKASQIYQDTKGYIEPILRHSLMAPIDYREPGWKCTVSSDVLFAIFFASEWSEDNEKDKQVMEYLSNTSYTEFSKKINELSKENDPPIRRIGTTWQLISKIDFWLIIAPLITREHLDRLGSMIQVVITDIDPSFDLPSEKKFMAGIMGEMPLYSEKIKRGFGDTLAILSVYGDEFSNQLGGDKPSVLVNYWLHRIFEQNNNSRFWYSIRNITTFIAEAAPDAFLAAVEKGSMEDESIFLNLFKSEGDGVFGGCYHSSLLWGLEKISWNKQYLARVSQCLSRLSEIDPGGKMSNRPFNSLVDIYLGWLNNTSANHDERLQILEKVIVPQYSEVAWRLMSSLLLDKTNNSFGVCKPQYQEWCKEIEKKVTNVDYYKYVESIGDIMLQEVDVDMYERIGDLIQNFDSYTPDQQDKIIKMLLAIDKNTIPYEHRKQILEMLRQKISRHREYPEENWTLPTELIVKLENVYNFLQFENTLENNIFLFNDSMPELIDPLIATKSDYKEQQEWLQKKRLVAFCAIYEEQGIEGLEELLIKCSMPELVGIIAYNSLLSEVMQSYALNWLEEDDNKKEFSVGYLSTLAFKNIEEGINIYKENVEWQLRKKIEMLLCMPLNAEVLILVEKLPENGQRMFWVKVNPYSYITVDLISHVSEKLLKYDRPLAALEILFRLISKRTNDDYIKSKLLKDILIKIATEPKDIENTPNNVIYHQISQVIKFLQETAHLPEQQIQQIEWLYLKFTGKYSFSPVYLKKYISKNPSFFAQLVTWGYKRNDGKQDIKEELPESLLKQRTEKSRDLLNLMSILPGQNDDEIDKSFLNQWIDKTREIFKNEGRQNIGDFAIGQYLSRSPKREDDIWPIEVVREVIERVKSDEIDRGIRIGILNSRTATIRQRYAGGLKERELASKYEENAKKIELTSPRTANILRSIAKSYEFSAEREDMEVELES
ncbi:hypothetical protein [Bacillus cereus]|uniref:hypothetical protein n=1 Tax=Bacillus cereus TaxID=1396 RepID=UPI000BF9D4C2|nr:hypothetical protein [Bacillus cereus]PFK50067.1 hypothetical protein COJ14_19010 [Bacillus cereus]